MAKMTYYCPECGMATYDGPEKYCAYCQQDESLVVLEMCYRCMAEPQVAYGLCADCDMESRLPHNISLCETCFRRDAEPGSLECKSCQDIWDHRSTLWGGYSPGSEDYYWEQNEAVIPSAEDEVETIVAVAGK